VVIHAAQHDRVAAAARQPGIRFAGLEHHDVRQVFAGEFVAQRLDPAGVEVGREHLSVRADFPGESGAQLALAGSDIGDRHPFLEPQRLADALHLRSARIETEAGPVAATGQKQQRQAVDDRLHWAHSATSSRLEVKRAPKWTSSSWQSSPGFPLPRCGITRKKA
jgi:hypothetical protein